MTPDDDKRIDGPGREHEGGAQSSGVPAAGKVESGAHEPLGRVGMRHWRESTITEPGLDDRGNVFFAAVEMTRMPMILTDPRQPDNPIAFANKAFLDLTGYEEAEVLGRNCRFLQGANTDREAVRQLRECVAAREAISLEILNYRRDGTAFWNAVFIGPVYDKAGELLYFFASQLDVTRRRESEQSFRQAQKMESIGQLTAGLAHDFNNLLQVINGSLERLQSHVDPQDGGRYLKAASTAAERGAKLTRQLLAFARRSRLEPRPTDLTDLVGSISELLDSTVGARTELQLNLRRKIALTNVDPILLEMALLNVVINARDAMVERGGVITITTGALHLNGDAPARQLEPGDYVVLSVADEGAGMSCDVLARATEPFFTTKASGAGTGLGLAMAQGFVQQSGGRLEIESEVGRGTTVRMLFPVTRDKVEPPVPSGFTPTTTTTERRQRILLVEDSPEIRALAEETLRELGYEVVGFASGEEALEAFEADDRFDLVFSDIVMPGGMNGLVLAEAIQARRPDVPILLTTGYNDELALDGPRAGAMDVLGKPYRRNELVNRVQAALRSGARSGPGRRASDFGAAEA
ncbi:MAG: hybrid sensor histidine kinase/response regulator [Caulobacterales bacterium 68-7]|nr:MAG: hybrid sensor histidine kinase/response regulator [Caulobacterales bacterium 68-7]